MSDTIRTAPRGGRRATPRAWRAVLVLSLLTAAYGALFAARGRASFSGVFAATYNAHALGILGHAVFGTLAVLAGPFQFRRDLRARRPRLHRVAGRVYVAAALGTGATGLFMAPVSYGGTNTHVAFGLLAVLVLATTGMGFARIRAGDVPAHRAWMLRSFALIFGGVALRVELPLLTVGLGLDFAPGYAIVAWLAWVPNLLWAEWHLRRSRGVGLPVHAAAAVR